MGRRGVCSDLAIASSARVLFARSQQPEEARARPVRSCDLFGDLGQGRITGAGILKPIFRHRDGVGPAMPFADKARTRFQAETWCGADAACRTQGLRQRPQLTTRRLAEPAVFNFLKPVANPEDQQIVADPRDWLPASGN